MAKAKKINELENRVKQLEQSNTLLDRKVDDGKSYLRRQFLRLVGIPQLADEDGEVCLEKLKLIFILIWASPLIELIVLEHQKKGTLYKEP